MQQSEDPNAFFECLQENISLVTQTTASQERFYDDDTNDPRAILSRKYNDDNDTCALTIDNIYNILAAFPDRGPREICNSSKTLIPFLQKNLKNSFIEVFITTKNEVPQCFVVIGLDSDNVMKIHHKKHTKTRGKMQMEIMEINDFIDWIDDLVADSNKPDITLGSFTRKPLIKQTIIDYIHPYKAFYAEQDVKLASSNATKNNEDRKSTDQKSTDNQRRKRADTYTDNVVLKNIGRRSSLPLINKYSGQSEEENINLVIFYDLLPKSSLRLPTFNGTIFQQSQEIRKWFDGNQPLKIKLLSLHNKDLTSIPPEIGKLKNLEIMHISNNYLQFLPDELGNCTRLVTLSAHNNFLSELPKTIGQLKKLQRLDLHNNQLTFLPKEITSLHSLRVLNVDDNELTEFPPNMDKLSSLGILTFLRNKGISLPKSISDNIEKQGLLYYKEEDSRLAKQNS